MGKTEYIAFFVLATMILLVFMGGIIVFIFQYHRRKLVYEKEKALINEQHIQDLLNTKLEIQEHTMQDIGREIHDNVGQRLTLASLYTNQLSYQGQYPDINERIEAIGKIINESLDELRSLSKTLTNATSEMSELKELIEQECVRVNGLNICVATCTFPDTEIRFSTTLKNFILRILQEFIQNSLKHARCTRIGLTFANDEAGLTVTACDDGQGFDSSGYKAGPEKGIGLSNMKKRAELIGADFSFNSEPGKGTQMCIFIPADKLNAH